MREYLMCKIKIMCKKKLKYGKKVYKYFMYDE